MTEAGSNTEEQAKCGEWVTFGTIIDLMMPDLQRVWTFINALEAGKLAARRIGPPPPATGNPVLDDADPSSTGFWRIYRDLELGISPAEMEWTGWLRSLVEVELTPALRIFVNEAPRIKWSDIQALAWVASNDGNLVSKVGNTVHGDKDTRRRLRTQALEYLRVHVAMKHCCCGASEPRQCGCLMTASEELVASLCEKRLHASVLREDGSYRELFPPEIQKAPLDLGAGIFALVGCSDEVRFDESEVRSTCRLGSVSAGAEPAREDAKSIAARSPAVKQGRPPGDEEILAKAYDLRSRFGWDGYAIASRMRFEPGFENVATTDVRRVIKGKFPRGPRRKPETER